MSDRLDDAGSVLVTGGAGYIGSHAVLALRDAGQAVVVLDDLSTGRRGLLPPDVPLVVGSVADEPLVAQTLQSFRVDAVMHFAGSIVVPESVIDPLKYYLNNTAATAALARACLAHGIEAFVFSSTAAVYGDGADAPLTESAALAPVNPYGQSKLMSETMLFDAARAHGLRVCALRYFNVAGADPAGRSGQATPDATHLIKIACEVATGKRAGMRINGTDYPTPDGTCIRDYIHVSDLISAHLLALGRMRAGWQGGILNCGYGHGASVREVVQAVERAAGKPINAALGPRRAGDAVSLIADPSLVKATLGWAPALDDLDRIVSDALRWERQMERLDF